MKINDVIIYDTFAEAWDLEVIRVVLTALSGDLAPVRAAAEARLENRMEVLD